MIDPKFLEYPQNVLSGEIIASTYIKLACQRFLDWLKRDDIEFIQSKAEKAIKYIQKLKHFQGKHSGKNFILSDWQVFIVANIFGFYWKGTSTV